MGTNKITVVEQVGRVTGWQQILSSGVGGVGDVVVHLDRLVLVLLLVLVIQQPSSSIFSNQISLVISLTEFTNFQNKLNYQSIE